MIKPSGLILFILLIIGNSIIAQCDFTNPEEGLNAANPHFLCGDLLDGYFSRLPLTDSPGDQPLVLCSEGGNPDNILWFTFIPTSFNINFSISYSNCTIEPTGDHLQGGIYADPFFMDEVACSSFPPSSPLNLSASGLNPGQVYYLFVDGAAGSVCDFQINVISGVSNGPVTFHWEDNDNNITASDDLGTEIQINQNACSGTDSLYTYVAPTCEMRQGGSLPVGNLNEYGLFCYEWDISPATGWNIVGDPNAKSIEIDWDAPGTYTISVNINAHPNLLDCNPVICTDPNDIIVEVNSSSTVVLDTIFFCADQPELFCNNLITRDTVIECIQDFSTCINEVQPFKVLEYDTMEYGVQVLCGSECFELFGINYCDEGSFVMPDPSNCEIRHAFTIESFRVDIDLPASLELDCDVEELEIFPDYTTNYTGTINTYWLEGGNIFQSGDTLTIDRPGLFTFVVEFPDLAFICSGMETIEIRENVNAPVVDVNVPTLNCDFPVGLLSYNSSSMIDSLSWYNDLGFESGEETVMVNSGGDYHLYVRGSNGCITDIPFNVVQDLNPPSIELNYENLDCVVASTMANFNSDLDVRTVEWIAPDNSTANTNSYSIAEPGDYQLRVTATNGCETIVPFIVSRDVEYPVADAGEDQLWQCNTNELTLNGSTDNNSHEIAWDFINEGNIISDANRLNIQIGSPGSYRINVTNLNNGCNSRDTVMVTNNDNVPENLEAIPTSPSCYGMEDGMIQIMGVEGGTEPFRYFLNGQPLNETELITDLSPGSYTIQVLDNFDCSLNINYILEEKDEIVLDVPNRLDIGFNEDGSIVAVHNITEEELSGIFWYDENGNLIGTGEIFNITGYQNTVISVEVVDLEGCSISRSIPVFVDIDLPVFAPNIFSPNNDGFNDVFTLYSRDYPGFVESMSIFTRWGELVYTVRDLDFGDESRGWDGRKNGKFANPAVYTYIAVIQLLDGSSKNIQGSVTLVR